MANGLFSDRELRALRPREREYKIAEKAPRGEGRLLIKVHPSGLKEFYYRMRTAQDDTLIRIGSYEQTPGYGGMSLAAARTALKKLVALHRSTGNAKAELLNQKQAQLDARIAADRAARLGTFEQLLNAYVADLRARGRVSARAVENAFQRDVKQPFPELCRGRANAVIAGDIQAILAKLVLRGVRRGVNLLRSHLTAAFQYAAKSDNDPTRLAHDGAVFEIAANPVTLVPRKAEFEGVGNRHLSSHELHRFWHQLDKVDYPVARAFFRFDLALGGQRGIQLIRPLWPAYDFEAGTVLLKDGKGRGDGVRDHLLPLTELALEVLAPLRALNGDEPGPFVSTHGKFLHPSTVSHTVQEVWEALAAEDHAKGKSPVIEKFCFADIRRSCETLLGSIGVSLEHRSHVLSHGRSGVQAKHYDRWEYLAEKRRALRKWERYLNKKVIAKPDRPADGTANPTAQRGRIPSSKTQSLSGAVNE